jgi:Domain of unknown function (DUF5069)
MWLPRFIDKARLHFSGTLPADFQRAFCSPMGIDGVFFAHFKLAKEEILPVIRREGSDEAVGLWFTGRPDSGGERIPEWNLLAPKIGMRGQPSHRIFVWGLKNLYGGCTDPRVVSGFTAIAWDEGFIDEARPEGPESGPGSGTPPAAAGR